MANPDLPFGALQKSPRRGHENAEKRKVRARDRRCRRPNCHNCRLFKPSLDVAHHRAKGMGGDKGTRSTADQMFLLDHKSHLEEYEVHTLEAAIVDPARGTAGPLDFYTVDGDVRIYEGRTEPLAA